RAGARRLHPPLSRPLAGRAAGPRFIIVGPRPRPEPCHRVRRATPRRPPDLESSARDAHGRCAARPHPAAHHRAHRRGRGARHRGPGGAGVGQPGRRLAVRRGGRTRGGRALAVLRPRARRFRTRHRAAHSLARYAGSPHRGRGGGREGDRPDVASLYGGAGGRVVAVRSPYYVPELPASEPAPPPLIRLLDTLGRPMGGGGGGIATIRRPALPPLSHLVNAGAVAVAPDGSVYFAPRVRDEIRKFGPGGEPGWTAKRGLPGPESDPVFLPPPRGSTELRLRKRLVNVALVLGPDGRLYALGSEDSSATRLRSDGVDTATGAIVATRQLGARPGAVAVDRSGALVLF